MNQTTNLPKTLVIMRGLPGSGKSTYIKNVYGESNPIVCSADYFFEKDGVYTFNGSKLKEAHQTCRNKCEEAMKLDSPLIIVDNTNTTLWEYQPYLDLATQYSYEVRIEEPQTHIFLALKELLKHKKHIDFELRKIAQHLSEINVHGVPENKIYQMIERYQLHE